MKIILTFVAFVLISFGGTMLAVYAIHFDSSTDKMAVVGSVLFAVGATTILQMRKMN